MKTICFLLVAVTIIFLVSQAQGAEWVLFIKNSSNDEYFYDRETLSKLPKGIIKVWVKQIHSVEGRKIYIQQRADKGLSTKSYETLNHILDLWEINCLKRESRLMATSDRSTDGTILDSANFQRQPTEGWSPISPDSLGEILYKTVCSTPKKKK
jgi:hypothetical protein